MHQRLVLNSFHNAATRKGQRSRYRAVLHPFLRQLPVKTSNAARIGGPSCAFLRNALVLAPQTQGWNYQGAVLWRRSRRDRILSGRGGVVTHHRLTDGSSITMGDVPYNWPGVANQREPADLWLSDDQHKNALSWKPKGARRGVLKPRRWILVRQRRVIFRL